MRLSPTRLTLPGTLLKSAPLAALEKRPWDHLGLPARICTDLRILKIMTYGVDLTNKKYLQELNNTICIIIIYIYVYVCVFEILKILLSNDYVSLSYSGINVMSSLFHCLHHCL